MSPPFDFNLWDNLDEESVRLTSSSEFWIQVQSEADGLDIVPPANFSDSLQDSDEDWSIIGTPEEPHKDSKAILHDCMWAGSCTDSSNTFVPSELLPATPGQSLLRRDMSPSRPDTPPSLDGDEPPQFRHTVDVATTARRLLRDSVVAVAADHSYTARQQFDCLGVQTPSDSGESEEEIDVVSLGTCAQPLPAAPHVRADSLPRSPSAHRQHLPHAMLASVSPRQRPVARKRLVPPPGVIPQSRRRARGPARRGRRSHTDTDSEAEAPEMERRSIHNDMERLRRIGLKNLFDELKKQIPATRDKERAPKVVILREAASLCRKLNAEDIEREKLKKKQSQLMAKLKRLRTSLAMRYRSY